MKKKVLSTLSIFMIVVSLTLSVFAHSGRTDGSGGHRDNKNKSGLGSYHYHCGGYPPHLHTNGACPYKGGSISGSSSSGSTSSLSGSSGVSSSYSALQKVYATSITAVNVPSEINFGETAKLKVSVFPSNAEDKTILWESSDTSVLTVSNTGDLTAVGVGTATITAKTSRGTSKKFVITSKEIMAENISIANNDTTMLIGDVQTLECIFYPENTTNKTIVWTSSDKNVISVTENGEAMANKPGIATITATHKQFTDSITLEVKPIDAESIEIILPADIETTDNGTPKLNNGSSMILKAQISPENATYKDIEWSVDDEKIATIDENGVLTSIKTGTIIVTAKAKSGITEEIKIEIYSDTEDAASGIIGLAGIGCISAIWYYRRKRKKEAETE